jgi:hypothetical protein
MVMLRNRMLEMKMFYLNDETITNRIDTMMIMVENRMIEEEIFF